MWRCGGLNAGPKDSSKHVYECSWLLSFAAGSPDQRGTPAAIRSTLGSTLSESVELHTIFYDARQSARIVTVRANG